MSIEPIKELPYFRPATEWQKEDRDQVIRAIQQGRMTVKTASEWYGVPQDNIKEWLGVARITSINQAKSVEARKDNCQKRIAEKGYDHRKSRMRKIIDKAMADFKRELFLKLELS